MSGLLGLFGNKDKEEQEKIGTAMKNLSDQIASLQQQGQGKDSEISRLKEELSDLQSKAGGVGDAAKKQMQDMNARLDVYKRQGFKSVAPWYSCCYHKA